MLSGIHTILHIYLVTLTEFGYASFEPMSFDSLCQLLGEKENQLITLQVLLRYTLGP